MCGPACHCKKKLDLQFFLAENEPERSNQQDSFVQISAAGAEGEVRAGH